MDVEMRHAVAEDERVHVLGAFTVFENAGNAIDENADGGRLFAGQVTETGDVTLRFHDHPPPIGGGIAHRVDMSGINEIILEQDPTLRAITLPVLLADETADVVYGHDHQSFATSETTPIHLRQYERFGSGRPKVVAVFCRWTIQRSR